MKVDCIICRCTFTLKQCVVAVPVLRVLLLCWHRSDGCADVVCVRGGLQLPAWGAPALQK